MDIKYWSGGLTSFEVEAIEKIKDTFCDTIPKEPQKLSSLKELSSLKNDMFPWRGYAGFRFVDKSGYEGEFDLVVITHCNVLIVELKHWNGEITYANDSWYQNGEYRGRSPVSITRNKKQLLENKLDKHKQRFTNKGYRPHIHFFVVITGTADFSQLPEAEKPHVITLKDFLAFQDKQLFNQKFRPHPNSQVLNQDFYIFDELFGENNVKPKNFRIQGYAVENEPDFSHPKNIYEEFLAKSDNKDSDQALIRRWDFNKIANNQAKTPEGRYRLISREYEVLETLKVADESLYGDFLTHKRPPSKQDITSDYAEIFGILPSNKRFNVFIEQHAKQLSDKERLGLVQILLEKFARLHEANIAHRDLGRHSVWISSGRKITLSGLISAYFPKEGTVGDIREILAVSGKQDLAYTDFPKDNITAFEHDVRSLAVLVWHLIQAKPLSPNSLKSFKADLQDCQEWYGDILRQALCDKPFKTAVEFLELFNSSKPEQSVNFLFDYAKLESFLHNINHSRQYREDDDFIIENDEKEVYVSNGQLVKAWLNIQYENNDITAHYLYRFLEKISQLKSLKPDYVPTIHQFGIAQKSASLFMVSDFIKGISWSEINDFNTNTEQKLEVIFKLIHAVEHLHGLGLAHGDLHPENVKIALQDDNEAHLYLLDILDYTPHGKSNLNYQYSPISAENTNENIRDNFAVMKMTCELLGLNFGNEMDIDSEHGELAKIIKTELEDDKAGFISLERFKKALKTQPKVNFIDIKGRGDKETVIHPDNGELFVQLITDKKSRNKIRLRFIGIGGSFDVLYNSENYQLEKAFEPRHKDEIYRKDRENSALILPFGLKIFGEKFFDLSELNILLKENTDFIQSISSIQAQQNQKNESLENEIVETLSAIEDNSHTLTEDNVVLPEKLFKRPHVRDLWTAILRTEIEALPYVEVVQELRKSDKGEMTTSPKIRQNEDRYYIYYEGTDDTQELDRFRNDDVVELIVRDNFRDRDIKIGKLNLKDSNGTRLCLNKEPKNTWALQDNSIIYLQSRQNEASFKRRRNALARILENESVITELPEYFDERCILSAKNYGIEISDDDFARYDRKNERGDVIASLNNVQREAFKRLLNNGPLSLLQGPPGTGKTEFISAFVHFLFEKNHANNILLVSQSHEAVNTAAERIRRHCQNLGTPLEMVRFSNRESTISTELQDVFSQNIISAKKEILQATQIERIAKLGKALGIDSEYLKQRSKWQLGIGTQIERYLRLSKESYDIKDDKDKDAHKKLCRQLEQSIKDKIDNERPNFKNLPLNQIIPILIDDLDKEFAISAKQSKRAYDLIKLTQDMQNALSNERVGYDEFLARSRQLVVGTCVGVGQTHIGVGDNIYDWVIIDEAGRSVSSELAIAMQSGKRILLVGDHKQLPPLYHDEHKNALARRLAISAHGEELDYILGSDFERVFESKYGEQVCASLQTQYRMAPAIGSLVSQCFYDGKLKNGKKDSDVSDIYLKLPKIFHSYVTWVDTGKLVNTYHIKAENNSLINHAEADYIIELLQNLANNDEFCESDIAKQCQARGEAFIGIICMYGEQKRLIRKKFNEKVWSEHFKELIKIDTVDSYQGKENRIIILSVTRNNKECTAGFLRLPNRINVALSRAMDRLIIVGAANMWTGKNAQYPLGQVLSMIKRDDNRHYYWIYTA